MGSVEKPDIKSRLAALKNKRTKSILQNRKAVYEEASGLKSKHEEIKKLQDPIDDEESVGENEPGFDKIKGIDINSLDYTVEQDELWEKKQNRRKNHFDLMNGELQNYKQLAEKTYTKNIHKLKDAGNIKTDAEYEKEKEMYEKMTEKGLKPEEIRSNLTSNLKLDKYIKHVKEWEDEVYKKRVRVSDEGKEGAIHEKNRQFNSKLNRYNRNN